MIVRHHERSKRHRLLQLGIFFLIYTCYTCFHALSANIENPLSSENVTISSDELEISSIVPESEEVYDTTIPSYSGNSSLIPRRFNCTPPAIEQFPAPLIPASWRKNGGLVVHILVAVFTFMGLAVVCDDYFVSSLDRICESFKLSPDVAGATFMAAGSSAPELALAITGVFLAKDDIGVRGVIGSAVFNIMFVISVCVLCSGTVSHLNWWPLVRDCTFYSISILIMLIVIWNDIISWPETLVMLVFYVVYCVALHFNSSLEKWAEPYILYLPIEFPQRAVLATENWNTPITDNQRNSDAGAESIGYNQTESSFDPSTGGQHQVQKPYTTTPTTVKLNKETDHYKPIEPRPKDSFHGFILYPIHYMCRLTMVDVKLEKYKNYYPLTFTISMIWISFYSYIMVWMITIIGFTLGIPDTVMGLTFVAAGVSVPDFLRSIVVIKEGYGDMAVSNAFGSSIFNILICLGLPWFIQTAMIKPGSHVNVISKGHTYLTLTLLCAIVVFLIAIHKNSWKLDKKLGLILMFWFLFFIIVAALYEFNVFGSFNSPECPSMF